MSGPVGREPASPPRGVAQASSPPSHTAPALKGAATPRPAPVKAAKRPRRDLKGNPLGAEPRDLPPGRSGDRSRRSRERAQARRRKLATQAAADAAKAEAIAADARATQAKKTAFLDAFGRIGTVTGAAQVAGITARLHYDWMDLDLQYVEEFAAKGQESLERLEAEARRRAAVGVEKPVLYAGNQVLVEDTSQPPGPDGRRPKKLLTEREYSDILLIFLMKGLAPQKYRDNYRIEHTGAEGGPVEFEHRVTFYLPANPRAVEQTRLALPPAETADR